METSGHEHAEATLEGFLGEPGSPSARAADGGKWRRLARKRALPSGFNRHGDCVSSRS
jgi:hypothetical protein